MKKAQEYFLLVDTPNTVLTEQLRDLMEDPNIVLFNASRPLWSSAEYSDLAWLNDWSAPFIHGRHYGILKKGSDRFEWMYHANISNDGWILKPITYDDALDGGKAWYEKYMPHLDIDYSDESHRDHVVIQFVKKLNGVK